MQINAIAKVSDFVEGRLPSELRLSIFKDDQKTRVNVQPCCVDKKFECSYEDGKFYFYLGEEGTKVCKATNGKYDNYCAMFASKKWLADMPNLKSGRLVAKYDSSFNGYVVDLSHIVPKLPKVAKVVEVSADNQNVDDHNKMTTKQAARCIQYLNKFIMSELGKGYSFEVTGSRLRMTRLEVIE